MIKIKCANMSIKLALVNWYWHRFLKAQPQLYPISSLEDPFIQLDTLQAFDVMCKHPAIAIVIKDYDRLGGSNTLKLSQLSSTIGLNSVALLETNVVDMYYIVKIIKLESVENGVLLEYKEME